MIYGVAARGAHISAPLTQAMSVVIFAGSAQFAVVQLVAVGTPAIILVLTGVVLNLRHVLYSATLAPPLRASAARWKVMLAYLLTDEMFGVVVARLRAGLPERERLWYALGAGLGLWIAWQLSTLAGVLLGAKIPSGWSLDFTATLTFIALAVPLIADRAGAACALAAAVAAVVALSAPLKLGLVAATMVGVMVGLAVERSDVEHMPKQETDQRELAGPFSSKR
jgi:predicted branched-subunit amino acid permease